MHPKPAGVDLASEGPTNTLQDEFRAEAQELLDRVSGELSRLEPVEGHGVVGRSGGPRLETLHGLFRDVHTLKGLAGMVGHVRLGTLAHSVEDLLDDVRHGRVLLRKTVIEVLLDGVDGLQRLIDDDDDPTVETDLHFIDSRPPSDRLPRARRRVDGARSHSLATPFDEPLEQLALDAEVRDVLTDLEAQRLRIAAERGWAVYSLRVVHPLVSLDSALLRLGKVLVGECEVITYLPGAPEEGEDAPPGQAVIDVLVTTSLSRTAFDERLSDGGIDVQSVRSLSGGSPPQPASVSSVPTAVNHASGAPAPSTPPTPTTPSALSHDGRPDDMDASAWSSLYPPRRGAQSPRPSSRSPSDARVLRVTAPTVRVDLDKLDRLAEVAEALGRTRAALDDVAERAAKPGAVQAPELVELAHALGTQLDWLQTRVSDIRLAPLGHVFERLARVVRSVARERHKDVRFVATGGEAELDKGLVDELTDPLMHLVRNAIDHGIESGSVRRHLGKPEVGTLAINSYRRDKLLIIEVEDDGGGIDLDRVRSLAVERGLLTESRAREASAGQLCKLLYEPGFSTSTSVTDVSGRGVGLDVVHESISRLGGTIDVDSHASIGTKFTIALPVPHTRAEPHVHVPVSQV